MCKARPVRSCKGPLPFTVPTLVRTVTEADAMQTAAELKAKGVHFIKVDDTLTREAYFAVAADQTPRPAVYRTPAGGRRDAEFRRQSTQTRVECLHNDQQTRSNRIPPGHARHSHSAIAAARTRARPCTREAHQANVRGGVSRRDRIVVSRPASIGSERLDAATWDQSDKGKRARFYRLTPVGRKQLAVEQSKWESFSRAMSLILKPTNQES